MKTIDLYSISNFKPVLQWKYDLYPPESRAAAMARNGSATKLRTNCYKNEKWILKYYPKSYLFGRGSFQRFFTVLWQLLWDRKNQYHIKVMEALTLQTKMGSSPSQESITEWKQTPHSLWTEIRKSLTDKKYRDNGNQKTANQHLWTSTTNWTSRRI